MKRKCLDTYALVEISKANPAFALYLSQNIVITDVTLAEFYAVLLREDGKQTAEYWFRQLEAYSEPVDRSILKEAVIFRYEHRQQKISFFDAVGYLFSLRNGDVFVTGDKEFKGLKWVEYRPA